MMNKKKQGFTLIEVIITMAIVAILTTIAVPTYQSSVRKSRRIEAIATLLDIQLRQEKWLANNSRSSSDPPYCEGKLDCPHLTSDHPYYKFEISSAATSKNTYKIQAKAKEGTDQLNDKEKGEPCSTLTLYQTGKKCPEVCWWGKETSEGCPEE
jgi:type IV pilus assembly protein PilE